MRGDTGQPLRIDLYKRNCFILEAKQSRLSPDKGESMVQEDLFGPAASGRANRRPRWDADMRAAFNQAWDYANRLPAAHERPPFIVTCDVGRTFEFHSDFTGQGRAYRAFPDERRRVIALEDLAERGVRDQFHAVWEHPASLDPARRRAEATREVAAYLAQVSRAGRARRAGGGGGDLPHPHPVRHVRRGRGPAPRRQLRGPAAALPGEPGQLRGRPENYSVCLVKRCQVSTAAGDNSTPTRRLRISSIAAAAASSFGRLLQNST